MIKDKVLAEEIHSEVFKHYKKMHSYFIKVKDNCSEEEIDSFRKAVGTVLGYTITDIMNPIETMHPSLRPTKNDFKKI